MRIISGTHKGKVLRPPKNLPLRPTTDLAKESLFNILNNIIDFEDIRVLDLFAGTGNISFEFCSRGAQQVVLVEQNFSAIRFIKEVSKDLNFVQLQAIKADVFKFLQQNKSQYDIIFADPPYDNDRTEQIIDLVFENNFLLPKGYLILEHDKFHDFSAKKFFKEKRKYGSVNFSFFVNLEE